MTGTARGRVGERGADDVVSRVKRCVVVGPEARAAAGGAANRSALSWLMIVFAVPVPVGVVVALLPPLRAVGEVSHWPGGGHGFFGGWPSPRGDRQSARLS